jgi:hypothetical protein
MGLSNANVNAELPVIGCRLTLRMYMGNVNADLASFCYFTFYSLNLTFQHVNSFFLHEYKIHGQLKDP